MYSDGTWLVLCFAQEGTDPRLGQYRLADIVASRVEQAELNHIPALELVTPLACTQDSQYGSFHLCFGFLDPIVAGVSFHVRGIGQVDGVRASGPSVAFGQGIATDNYFMAQWEGQENYESWIAFDSCGTAIQVISVEGAPTPCPPVR